MENEQKQEIHQEFKDAVNMTASTLEKWLKTEESKKVGWDSGDGESIGHFPEKLGARLFQKINERC
jgi:hypothetical protein